MTSVTLNSGQVPAYDSLSAFPASAGDGSLAVAKDTDSLYEFDGASQTWILIGPGGGGGGGSVTSVGLALPSIFSVSGSPVTTAGTLTGTLATQTNNRVFAGPATGADAAPTFRALQAVDIPNIAESQVTNLVSDLAGKQPVGNYITALTGDVSATGPGSVSSTLATVNSTVGSFGSSSSVSSFTVNAKGLITAASAVSIQISESQVTNLVSDLASKARHVIPSTNQVVYASSLSGSDVTGDGSYDNPWATVAHSMTQITDSGSNKPYTISLLAARQVETTDVLWKPYVFIVGGMQRASYIRINGGSFKPDASMTANSWIGFSDIYIGGGTAINFDMQAIGGNNLEFIIENCTVTGAFTIKGRNAGGGDYLEMYNCLTLGSITLDSVNFQLQAMEMGSQFTVTDTQATGATGTLDFSTIDVGISTSESMSLNDVSYGATAGIVTTAAATLTSYRGLPPISRRTLFSGTTIVSLDDATILPYTPAVSGNWSPIPSDVQDALDTLAAKPIGSAYGVQEFTLSGTDITNKHVTLSSSPAHPTLTVLSVIGGPSQNYVTDFIVTGSQLSWSGLFLDGVLTAGDILIVQTY